MSNTQTKPEMPVANAIVVVALLTLMKGTTNVGSTIKALQVVEAFEKNFSANHSTVDQMIDYIHATYVGE